MNFVIPTPTIHTFSGILSKKKILKIYYKNPMTSKYVNQINLNQIILK